uniref:Uncharacterized protein n=1 Tax=Schistosoma mansoni TaxID=6183 RepID=A0A5K4F9R6_SCHMA
MNFDEQIFYQKSQFVRVLMNIPSFIERKKLEKYFDCVIKGYKLQLISNLNTEFVKIMEKVEGEYANHPMNSSKSSEIKKCFENNAENAKRELKENHPENCPIPGITNKKKFIVQTQQLEIMFYKINKLNVNLFERQLLFDIFNKINS